MIQFRKNHLPFPIQEDVFMKILKLYANPEKCDRPYGPNSPLMKLVHARYDCDEIILSPEMSESELAELIRQYDVLLTMWANPKVPDELAENPGRLRYICNITGSVAGWISRKLICSPHLTVTNWGDAISYSVAEGAVALLFGVLKNIPHYVLTSHNDPQTPMIPALPTQGSLYGKRIGIYGLGSIGRKFIDFLRPFGPEFIAYDPFVTHIPDQVTMVQSLEELFDRSQIVSVHVGLTEATKGSITADLLSRLPDGGIIINTARGLIVDYDALKKELQSGRLRAGLDLATSKNMPAPNDPIRSMENVILSSHNIYVGNWENDADTPDIFSITCLDNLERFQKGEPLLHIMTPEKYDLST